MIVDELVARIGLDFTGASAAAQAVKSLNNFKVAALGVGGVLAGLTAVIAGVGISVAETVDNYADFGQAIGASVETIQTLTAAAEQSGGGFEDVARGLKTLTDQAGAAAKGNESSIDSFARLGVNIHGANGHLKTADQLIGDVADGLSKMTDPATQVNAAIDVLGKGAIKLLPALTTGRKGMQGFRAEMEKIGFVMSEASNKRFQKLGDNLDMLKLRATGAKNILAQAFLPFAEETIGKLNSLLEKSAGGLFEFGERFASVVTAPFKLFSEILTGLPNELIAIIAFGAALTAVFTVPAVAVIALAALIALISEDIYKFLHDQPSLLGDVINSWGDFLQTFRDLDKEAEGFLSVITRIGRVLADIAGFTFGGKKGRRGAFQDFLEATGINALGDALQRDPELDALSGQEPLQPAGALTTPFVPGRVPASLLANPSGDGPAARAQKYREVAHSPTVNINVATNATPEEIARAAEDAIIRSAIEIEQSTGARR